MTAQASIEVSGLRKRFGPTVALDGMSFTVAPGQVTGFVGPNGAGKSTTMRVILGLDAPDAGTALVGGQPYASLSRPLTRAGSLLDAGALQPSRTGRHHLLWLAHSQGLPGRRVDEVLVQAGLDQAAKRRAGGYSLRTAAPAQAMEVLARAGAAVAAEGPGVVTISGIPAERAVVLLTRHAVPFTEVSAHRATLEQAYLELTRDAVEFRAASPAGTEAAR
jgi:ABC-2 type transport system ATP-binding protein